MPFPSRFLRLPFTWTCLWDGVQLFPFLCQSWLDDDIWIIASCLVKQLHVLYLLCFGTFLPCQERVKKCATRTIKSMFFDAYRGPSVYSVCEIENENCSWHVALHHTMQTASLWCLSFWPWARPYHYHHDHSSLSIDLQKLFYTFWKKNLSIWPASHKRFT